MFIGEDPFLSWITGTTSWSINWEDKNKKYILSFSGGKDSTAMLLKMLEHNLYIEEVIYVEVGLDFPEMKSHIEKIKNLVNKYNIKFTTLKPEKSFQYWLGEHIKTKGKNKGQKGYGWPDFSNRWCTSQLKIQVLNKYYKNVVEKYNEPVEFVGIACDELERTEKNNNSWLKEYPLVYWGINEAEALSYCYSKGFDWGGLYEKFGRVSCYLCPLSTLDELRYVFKNYPYLWMQMRVLDDMSFKGYKIKQIDIKKNTLIWQHLLFAYKANYIPKEIIISLLYDMEKEGKIFRSDYTLKELERKFIGEIYEEIFGYQQMALNFVA